MQETNELVEHLGRLAVDLRRRCDPEGAALCLAAAGTILTCKDAEAVTRSRWGGYTFAGQATIVALGIIGVIAIL